MCTSRKTIRSTVFIHYSARIPIVLYPYTFLVMEIVLMTIVAYKILTKLMHWYN